MGCQQMMRGVTGYTSLRVKASSGLWRMRAVLGRR